MTTTYDMIESAPESLTAVAELLDWADNEIQPTTFDMFCALTGISDLWEGFEIRAIGYLEADKLARALQQWATHPNDVEDWVRKACDL